MPSWGKRKRKAGGGSARAGRRAVRQAVAEGGNDRDVTRRLVDVLATLSLVNAAELRELTATVFKTYLVPGSESVAEAIAEAGRLPLAQSRASPKQSAQTPKSNSVPRTCMCGWRSSAVWRRRGGWQLKSYWESNVVKSAPVQLAARVRHCRAKPCRKIEGKEGWMRIVFCLDPVTLFLEGALEAALQLQKGVRKHGTAPRGPLEREASKGS